MGDSKRISGTLQFYPRKRASKVIPSANWKPLEEKDQQGILGFICYKVRMKSLLVKDNTEDSMTKSKRITIPCTILECPPMKILSIRFYKGQKVLKDIIVSNEKILKKKIKVPKKLKDLEKEIPKEFDNIRILVYSSVKETGIGKKSPDILEIGLGGSKEDKLNFIKEKWNKPIYINEVFSTELADIRAVTKGKGTQGPVKRFGISLKDHKSEKGVRRPGSLAPWRPARVTFRAPMAGQTGYHNRISYNQQILEIGKINQKDINPSQGFEHYGKIKTDYILLKGSVIGPSKRPILLTKALRPSKRQIKKQFEILAIR